MQTRIMLIAVLAISQAVAAPRFEPASPVLSNSLEVDGVALCQTAKNTLAYLNQGTAYDPAVINAGSVIPIPLQRIKATLSFVCQHQHEMQDPAFIKQHFQFIKWIPDTAHARQLSTNKPLLQHLPHDQILMTKYYVHEAVASATLSADKTFPLYAIPNDERNLSMEAANLQPQLTRFQYGKQAILKGALKNKSVPILAYLTRNDLESALLQGTVVADFGAQKKIFNVHRNNAMAYDKNKHPYGQERYWYFKEVDGIKGYGKDANYKISINPKVTFAADLNQLGLGKMMLIQYRDASGKRVSRLGVLADTGGAFKDNLYQVDYLAGSFHGLQAFNQATKTLPNYVYAYFMVLK